MKGVVGEKLSTDEKGKRKGRGVASGVHPVGAGSGRSEQRGSAVGSGEAGGSEWNEVPFSWVVRGRQESHLVDQQVRILRF